jgi:uncharacterized protein (TIGR03790 family)
MIARWGLLIGLAALLVFTPQAPALTPDQIALVVNKNAPESIRLAQLYSEARHIPNDRTIVLDVPSGDEIDFDAYERNVVPPIRDFLRSHRLRSKVTCLVTFFGVPFRIRAKSPTQAEKDELVKIKDQLNTVTGQVDTLVGQEEEFAKSVDPDFKPAARIGGEMLAKWYERRHQAALVAAGNEVNAIADPDQRRKLDAKVIDLLLRIGGPAELLRRIGWRNLVNSSSDDQRQHWIDLRDQLILANRQAFQLESRRYDAASRQAFRDLTAKYFGPLLLMGLLDAEIDYLTPGTTNAALDNELCLLWWNSYQRQDEFPNPLNYKLHGQFGTTPTVMVSRLDGPDVPTVEDMIQTSVDVEKTGLRGYLTLNSFNYPDRVAPDGRNFYLEFDWKIRALGRFAVAHSSMEVRQLFSRFFQNREATQTALYCGWYSLRHYIDGQAFVPGAVGYHVASLEMVQLHQPTETGWVRGLLRHGVVATLGAVAEPYLNSFPPPNEFFPLLMTGKLTLAETYWKTEPTSSWMICLIGDPLYNPFKNAPVVKVEDLPQELQDAITGAASTRPK